MTQIKEKDKMKIDNIPQKGFPVNFTGENTFFSDGQESAVDIFSKALQEFNMDTEDKTVYLTDPYLFNNRGTDYETQLISILKLLKAKQIYWMDSGKNTDKTLLENVKNAVTKEGSSLQVTTCEEYHDRVLICKETKVGIQFGASVNGMGGGRRFYVHELTQKEVEDTLADLTNTSMP